MLTIIESKVLSLREHKASTIGQPRQQWHKGSDGSDDGLLVIAPMFTHLLRS